MRRRESLILAMLIVVVIGLVVLPLVLFPSLFGQGEHRPAPLLWTAPHYQTKVFGDLGQPCKVSVFSPPYSPDARTGDYVTVLWDGEVFFDGQLPVNRSGVTGHPMHLLEIRCAPGIHKIQVRHGNQTEQIEVEVKVGDDRVLYLFAKDGQKETLIKDLGNNVLFL
jgi:hypothetical protein